MKKYAVIVAAGSGTRMGSSLPKQFLLLQNKPVLWHTATAFLHAFDDLDIKLVLPKDHFAKGESIAHSTGQPHRFEMIEGGETRFYSVRNGLSVIDEPSIIFVHDGVRCLVSAELIRHCYDVAIEKGNAIPAINSVDSLRVEKNGDYEIIDRTKIKIIQTPQTFKSEILKKAFEQEYQDSFTDEASVVERTGTKINLVEGEEMNIKITRPFDILIAEKFLESR
jgi:2-C-methyl-D-erythritol 4-phosphate cytidylyltransferase